MGEAAKISDNFIYKTAYFDADCVDFLSKILLDQSNYVFFEFLRQSS